jgi:ribosomal protein S18 acetylase RimI-like enzyme
VDKIRGDFYILTKKEEKIMSLEREPKPELRIREASLDDVAGIREMQAKSWVDTYPNEEAGVSHEWVEEKVAGWLTPEALEGSREHFASIFGNPDHFYRVATDGNRIIGLAHGSRVDGAQHLEALYVDSAYHGSGLARRLMDQLNSWFDQSESVLLEVASYNDRAQAFYSKYGYEVKPGSEDVFADIMPTVVMVKEGEKASPQQTGSFRVPNGDMCSNRSPQPRGEVHKRGVSGA